jgi:hypothetical protein
MNDSLTYEAYKKMIDEMPPVSAPIIIYLPARKHRGQWELVGLDAEVIKFHAVQTRTKWYMSEYLEPGQFLTMPDTLLPFDSIIEPINIFEPGDYYFRGGGSF